MTRITSPVLPLSRAGDDDDLVALLDLRGHHSTSGASEMIFMWFLARSSRGTGPKMRVPTGSALVVDQHRRIAVEADDAAVGRRMSLAVRTTTAFITSPFFTRPRGIASLTETTMMSPTEAYLRFEPPSTLMHMHATRAGIVGDIEIGLHLDHGLTPS